MNPPLHGKNSDSTFVSINCLEYVTIIINYCAALVVFSSHKIIDDPHPVVLCVMDNTNALNWTLHICKKLIISQALARFFCGLLIGSNFRVNTKWISTFEINITNKISRLKLTDNKSSSFPSYDHSKLQQKYKELKACNFFQMTAKLLLLIWEVLLTQKCPDLKFILKLKLSNLGKVCT